MLVLSRDCDRVIRIGPDIKVKVLSIRKRRVKLGIDAPRDVRIWRDEIELQSSATWTGAGEEACTPYAEFPILIVEDNPDHADLIARSLTDCRFPEVTTVSTGKAAIDLLRKNAGAAPQLVLLDLYLPDISGLEVLRQIRSVEQFQTLPVVILSSAREEGIVAECLQAGANAFVNKSARFREFRESVSRIAGFWKCECQVPRLETKVLV